MLVSQDCPVTSYTVLMTPFSEADLPLQRFKLVPIGLPPAYLAPLKAVSRPRTDDFGLGRASRKF